MSGPPYPHPTYPPGSNAIGSFIIGTSPIGDLPPFDYWLTVASQYANSPILTAMIGNMGAYLDPTASIDAFFDTVMNLDSAVGFGLDVWGRRLGVARTLNVGTAGPFLGFEQAAPDGTGFGQGPFFSGQQLTTNLVLADAPYKVLLFAKALANICDGSTRALNALLRTLFPPQARGGNAYVRDNGNMSITIVFGFVPTSIEQAIILQSGVFPRPCGVAMNLQTP